MSLKNAVVIPAAVQSEVENRIQHFNEKHFTKKGNGKYIAQIKGKFIYLLHGFEEKDADPICRLTFDGDLENMDFAIYKYSSEKYDPKEWFFPGSECVNGTLEGAMKAGLKAYLS